MSARRREGRYRLSKPFEGCFLLFHEVDIEGHDDGQVFAVSDLAVPPGQQLRLDLLGSGPRATVDVQIVESTPIIVDGKVRYQLRLDILS